ncbi:Ig-like domain-containing protein, partial [Leifsonia aquatica]|uniref:Ig-like domain-containing protein n=1 Tax=Leifsonia aquatica TaxID=144185 RepID=UPI00384EA87A
MNNSFKKRAGRAAIAGATLLGLAAGGLAAAAPASAADGSGMVTGPLASPYYSSAMVVDTTGLKMEIPKLADVPAKMAAGQIAYWTYPGPGAVGTISRNGSCMVSATGLNRLNNTIARCDDTAIGQKWFGQSNGTVFKLSSRYENGRPLYQYYPDVTTSNATSGYTEDNNFALGLQLAADYMTVAPSLTTPLPGADITPGTVFSGAAEPGTLITVLDKDGKEIGRATAGADKTWSLKLDPAPINGLIRLKVVATDTGGKATTLADDQYTMKGSDEARAYTGPTSGDITPETVFTGTGAKGETVVIKDGTGKVIGQTTVGQDGHWSTTLNPVPTNGSTDIVVEITGKNGVTEQLASETLTMTGSEEPNAYTGPTSGIVTPDTVFTGTGTKGETVTITDSEGNVLGSTVIGDDGQWSLTLDNPPVNGEHNLFVKIGDETIATPKVEMTGSDEAPGYTGPEDGTTITPDTVFTGTGGKGETVVIKDGNGNILGEGVVGDDGQWSLTLDNPPVNGDVNLVIEVGGNKVADTNVVMEGSDELPGYTGPEEGATVTPDTVFTGTGGKGETVVIKDGNGNILGEGVVGD